jgi:hypothetical protein
VFNATFSNISAISWRPVLVVEEAGVLGENPSANSSRIGHHRFGGVMVSVLASSEVDRGIEPQSGQTKDYEIGIGCFSAKHSALRRKSKDWLAQNQNNVSEWSDMSTEHCYFIELAL